MGTQVNLKRSSEIEAMYERSNVNVKVDYDVLTCDLSYFNSILSTHVALTRVVKHVKIRRQWQSTPTLLSSSERFTKFIE